MSKRLLLALDLVLLVMLGLMAGYQLVSAAYHELAGIVLCGLFILHFALHSAWISAKLRRFGLETPLVKGRWLLDGALLFVVLSLGVSGILISRTLRLWTVRPVPLWVVGAHHALGFLLVGLAVIHLLLCAPQLKRMLHRA
ncbi:MAG: hypothetical protein FWD65_02040 [Coriobacteriia bacterium]|nr:hypothetical protein [Coriobacteriia bacterium]